MSAGKTEEERQASQQTHIIAFEKARVELAQREIDKHLDILRKTGSAEDKLAAFEGLLTEFDRTDDSPYHLQFEVSQEAYERLRGENAHLVTRVESAEGSPGATHYFVETRGVEGQAVRVNEFSPFTFRFTRIVQRGKIAAYAGDLGISEISGIKIIKTPQEFEPRTQQ